MKSITGSFALSENIFEKSEDIYGKTKMKMKMKIKEKLEKFIFTHKIPLS